MLDVKKLLTKMMVVPDRHNIPLGNIAGSGYKSSTGTVTKSGYTPIGVIGFMITSSYIHPSRVELTSASDGSGTISYEVRNIATGQATSVTLYVDVLWHKS